MFFFFEESSFQQQKHTKTTIIKTNIEKTHTQLTLLNNTSNIIKEKRIAISNNSFNNNKNLDNRRHDNNS